MKLNIRLPLLSLLLMLLTNIAVAQNYQIERVEPLHWWVGMENPELQLMIYGDNIGSLTPKIDYEGVSIKRIQKVENDNYLFIYLNVAPGTKAGSFDIQLLDANNQPVLNYSYTLKEREENSAHRRGVNSSDVLYLVTPDRFANGNPDNDNVEGYADKKDRSDDYGRHGGDIQGIINHLEYIEEMGFTALWLNPVLENAMDESSYHGYATTDYYKVDPRFGSNRLYKKLSNEAEKRGIKLIMDMIMNHSGSNHWWMQDPPTSDWVHYPEEYQNTNHRRTTLHDPYASDIDKKQFTDGWFVKAMPDLNQDNPLLADYLIYNSLWWIEYAGLRGIRHDTHPYAGEEFMSEWTCRVMEEYPNFNIVGEEWGVNPLILAKWQRGSKMPTDFKSCLPSLMDFPLQVSLIESLVEEENWDSGFIDVYETLTFDYAYPAPNNLVIFPDNHDMDRFYRQVNNDFDLYKMGLTYVMTMRGIPQFYYGTELLMSNEKSHDHGEIREDFPGGWASDRSNAFTGEGLTDKQKEAKTFVKKLLNWRKDNPVIHNGQLMQYTPNHDGLYIYFRYNEQKTVMVIFNKNEKEMKIDTKRFYERLDGYRQGKDVITGNTYSLDNLVVPKRSAFVLELK
ncbi:glycoside hydrolase family 13 protein [Fodinibius halophilus]|uniref:Glycoside hydrolase family 13 protein n=1 Tax=Fodinibius halophilus TaxID=1736908 RepID=A0A6M1T1H8_9BACT|nr:glycoside hydrolase family 13 protein [Fodinibius halophilus]NGP87035.1 glycoside hydrolase family 13 protein [Fodinibius halophilus]